MTTDNPGQTHISSQNSIRCENDEVSLIELYIVLARRKKIIIITIVIALLIGIVYSWQWQAKLIPSYEGNIVVQVGHVGQLEGMEKIKPLLKVEYPFIKRIDSVGNLVTIIINVHDKAEVEPMLQKIIDKFIQEYSVIYNSNLSSKQQKYEFLRRQIDDIRSQIVELAYFVSALKKDEPVQASILVLEKIKLKQVLQGYEGKATNFRNLSTVKSLLIPTKLLHGPTVTDIPEKPMGRVIIIISIVLGLIFGIIGAFMAELIAKARQEIARVRAC